MNIPKYRLIAAFFFAGAVACSQPSARNASLCNSQEKVIFACGFKNNKVASICGSPDAAQSYVEYRFGSKSAMELTYKSSQVTPARLFHRAEVVYANNAEDTIWFKNGRYTYSIFLPARGTPGLEVSRDGDVVAHLECKGGWSGVTGDPKMPSRFIEDHGSSDPSTLEQFGLSQ